MSTPAIPAEIEAEFLRIPDAVKFSGIGKSTLFALIAKGKLKSKCIRQPGAVKGIRLISKQALRDFIDSCEEDVADRPKRSPKKTALEGGQAA